MAKNIPDKLYHCFPSKILGDILTEGLKPGFDGVIYFADSFKSAAIFLLIRGHQAKDLFVIEVPKELLDKNKIDESFDHSEEFFKCKAYVYGNTIPKKTIEKCNVYKIQEEK